MLMGTLVYGIRYTIPEYVCSLLVVGGVSTFALLKASTFNFYLKASAYFPVIFLVSYYISIAIDSQLRYFCFQTSSKTMKKLANPNAPLGYGLCFLNLAFDGFTNATQDSISTRYFLDKLFCVSTLLIIISNQQEREIKDYNRALIVLCASSLHLIDRYVM